MEFLLTPRNGLMEQRSHMVPRCFFTMHHLPVRLSMVSINEDKWFILSTEKTCLDRVYVLGSFSDNGCEVLDTTNPNASFQLLRSRPLKQI